MKTLTLLSWTWFATCIFGAASIACAQSDVQKLERAFQLVNSIQISGAQAEAIAQAKQDIRQVYESLSRIEAEKLAEAERLRAEAEAKEIEEVP